MSTNDKTRAVYGIDLGTTYSCISQVDQYDQAIVLTNFEGTNTTPSVVYFESPEKIIVGQEAKGMLATEPQNTVSFVKRSMGVDADFDKTTNKFPYHFDPSEISALILKKLVQDANDLGDNPEPVKDVVAGKYLTLERKWNKGDKISITFDMKCRVIDAPIGSNPESANFQAVEYGPIVLARDENTDANYNAPVKFVTDDAGTMNITPVKPLLADTRMEFEVPTANGKIRMSDYSSVNCWHGKKICTWIPRVR